MNRASVLVSIVAFAGGCVAGYAVVSALTWIIVSASLAVFLWFLVALIALILALAAMGSAAEIKAAVAPRAAAAASAVKGWFTKTAAV